MSESPGPTGPALARWMARLLLPPAIAARLLADLHEEVADHQLADRGRLGASWWYWRQLASSIRILRRHQRDAGRRSPWVGLGQDARSALRQLRRRPALTLASVATLALGIGATTAVFSVVDAVLLSPPPYPEPDRILRAWAHSDDGDTTFFSFRVKELRELAARSETFAAVGAEFATSVTVVTPGSEPRQVSARMITPRWFDVFGVRPQSGRMFDFDEIAAGDAQVALITEGFRQHLFGIGEPALDRTIEIAGSDYEIIGVLPATYEHPSATDVELFVPYTNGTSRWIGRWLDVYARPQPGVSFAVAEQQVNAVIDGVAETDGRSRGWSATVESLRDMQVGDVRVGVWATFGTVLLVLLIACVNVGSLSLAAMTSRRAEFRLRAALGAGRGRLIRQVFFESIAMALVGGALAVALAPVLLNAITSLAPAALTGARSASLDTGVLIAALAATMGTGVILGCLAGLQAGTDPDALRYTARTGSPTRRLESLVVAQVALALTLLTSAGLLARTVQELQREDLGFRRSGALSFRVAVPSARYPSGAETVAFFESLRESLGDLDGVTAVGAATDLPVSGEGAVATLNSEARIRAGIEREVTALQRRAASGFFEALGAPLLAGRDFQPTDDAEAETVTILSASLARALFGDGTAVGQRVSFSRSPQEDDWMTVIGVVGDLRYRQVDRVDEPQVYQAHPQSAARDMAVVVRASRDTRALIEPIREIVRRVDDQVPIYDVATLDERVATGLAPRRFAMSLFGLFAAIALALTLAGIYGVLAFVVGQRRTELGVRVALGASRRRVVRNVLARGMRPVLIGLVIGAVGGTVAARLLQTMLYGIDALDPSIHLGGAALVALVAAVVCAVPARRAARVDPVEALRAA